MVLTRSRHLYTGPQPGVTVAFTKPSPGPDTDKERLHVTTTDTAVPCRRGVTTSQGDRDRQLHQPTQTTLRQLVRVVEKPASPEVMARRARALLEIAESLQPQSQAPLWAVVGVLQPATEDEYMAFLRRLVERSGLSYQEIASRTEFEVTIETVPRSTIHGVLKRDRLPRREDQLRALLTVLCNANGGTRADLDSLLTLRAELIAARATASQVAMDQSTDLGVEPATSSCARCRRRRSPLVLAGAVSLVLATIVVSAVLVVAALHFFL